MEGQTWIFSGLELATGIHFSGNFINELSCNLDYILHKPALLSSDLLDLAKLRKTWILQDFPSWEGSEWSFLEELPSQLVTAVILSWQLLGEPRCLLFL